MLRPHMKWCACLPQVLPPLTSARSSRRCFLSFSFICLHVQDSKAFHMAGSFSLGWTPTCHVPEPSMQASPPPHFSAFCRRCCLRLRKPVRYSLRACWPGARKLSFPSLRACTVPAQRTLVHQLTCVRPGQTLLRCLCSSFYASAHGTRCVPSPWPAWTAPAGRTCICSSCYVFKNAISTWASWVLELLE